MVPGGALGLGGQHPRRFPLLSGHRRGARHSVLLMGSSVATIWSLLAFRRELWGVAIILMVQAVIFLAWSLFALVQDY
jgi:hypothetical protein